MLLQSRQLLRLSSITQWHMLHSPLLVMFYFSLPDQALLCRHDILVFQILCLFQTAFLRGKAWLVDIPCESPMHNGDLYWTLYFKETLLQVQEQTILMCRNSKCG